MKTGIIGYGKVGKIREKEIERNKFFKLVSIADTTFSSTEVSTSKKIYTLYETMLDKEELDCVFVCTPPVILPDIVVYCLNKGLHVFAEKPPGVCLEDVIKMKKALSQNPTCKLKFGFNHRNYQCIQKAKQVLESGCLGKTLWIKGTYGKDGAVNWRRDKNMVGKGIITDQGIHMLDLFLYLTKSTFISGKAYISYINEEYPIEDNVFGLLLSSNGIVASIHSSAVLWKRTFTMEIGLTEGYIKISGLSTSTRTYGYPEKVIVSNKENSDFAGNPKEEVYYFGTDNSWKIEIDDFAGCIRDNKPIKNGSIHDSEEVMKVLSMLYSDGDRT